MNIEDITTGDQLLAEIDRLTRMSLTDLRPMLNMHGIPSESPLPTANFWSIGNGFRVQFSIEVINEKHVIVASITWHNLMVGRFLSTSIETALSSVRAELDYMASDASFLRLAFLERKEQ